MTNAEEPKLDQAFTAGGHICDAHDVKLGITYTRVDERGSSLLASNWTPVMITEGRAHTTGNRAWTSSSATRWWT